MTSLPTTSNVSGNDSSVETEASPMNDGDLVNSAGQESLAVPVQDEDSQLRSSFEIMGCAAPTIQSRPVPGVGATLSRPPSNMPDFDFITTTPEIPLDIRAQGSASSRNADQGDGNKPYIPFIVSLFFVTVSLLSITATGAVTTVFKQIGKPVAEGYTAVLILSIVVFVFSAAGLGHVLYGPPRVLGRIPGSLGVFSSPMLWTRLELQQLRLPRLRLPHLSSLHLRWPAIKIRRPAESSSQPPSHLPHPKEFELDDLESAPRRPPTPYPGPVRPVPPVPSAQHTPQGRVQILPLGFPVPPTSGVSRMNSAVSRMSNVSFRSDPRSVSPMSSDDAPPTPPPKDPGFSRFQSREPLLPPAASGDPITESSTRASILTELCDAVQHSNPASEPGRAAENYSPLAMASSPAAGTTSRHSASIQSPKPAYQIELASPSRGKGKGKENEE